MHHHITVRRVELLDNTGVGPPRLFLYTTEVKCSCGEFERVVSGEDADQSINTHRLEILMEDIGKSSLDVGNLKAEERKIIRR